MRTGGILDANAGIAGPSLVEAALCKKYMSGTAGSTLETGFVATRTATISSSTASKDAIRRRGENI